MTKVIPSWWLSDEVFFLGVLGLLRVFSKDTLCTNEYLDILLRYMDRPCEVLSRDLITTCDGDHNSVYFILFVCELMSEWKKKRVKVRE